MGRKVVTALIAVIVPYGFFFLYFSIQSRHPTPPKPRLTAEALQTLETLEILVQAHGKSVEDDLQKSVNQQRRTKERIEWISKLQTQYGAAGDRLLSWAELIDADERRLQLDQKTIVREIKICALVIKGLREGIRRSLLLETLRPFDELGPKIQHMIDDTELNMKKTAIGIGINPRMLPEPAFNEWNGLSLIRYDQETRIASLKKMHSDFTTFAGALKKLAQAAPPVYDAVRFPF